MREIAREAARGARLADERPQAGGVPQAFSVLPITSTTSERAGAPSVSEAPLAGMAVEVDDVDAARAQEYALLSVVLARPADAPLLSRLAGLRGDASPLGAAHAAVAEAASHADVARVEREYFDLFIGLGRGELLPYGSYYLSGFLHERPLARLRAHLARLGIERAAGQAEPEDHAAILCEIMAELVSGRFAAPRRSDRELFEQHLAPWIGRFFSDLECAQAADFYRSIGMLGRVFTTIEAQAFAMPA
jgi:TorA maturation chaperone TorD